MPAPELTPDRQARRDAAIERLSGPVHADEVAMTAAGPPTPAEYAATFLAERFRERRYWLPYELGLAARNAAIDLAEWLDCPGILAMGLRLEDCEIWPGRVQRCYVLGAADGPRDDAGPKGD